MQVLLAMAEAQRGTPRQLRGSPCAAITEAAGLEGAGRQQARCHSIRMEAIRRLQEGEVSAPVRAGLETAITNGVVVDTAQQVLELPELLSLPYCLEKYLGQQVEENLRTTGGLKQTLLRLCLVTSPNINVTYYNHGDAGSAHLRQVRSERYQEPLMGCRDMQ